MGTLRRSTLRAGSGWTSPEAMTLAAVLALCGFAPGFRPATLDARQSPGPARDWLDAAGEPLPFVDDDDLREFLRTAEIIETEDIGIGVTDPIRVTLRQGDVTAHAVFRYVDTTYDRVKMSDGRLRMNLRDSCFFEPAAYELSLLLGMENVPPAVERTVHRRRGTLQLWVYNAVMESERLGRGERAPDRIGWMRQVQGMYLFDALIGNDDRTQQNILIDADWKMWLIDHTRSFYLRAEPQDLDKVIFVDRSFWSGLQTLDEDLLEEVIGEMVSGREISKVLERRDLMVAFIDGLVQARGEGAVFFDSR